MTNRARKPIRIAVVGASKRGVGMAHRLTQHAPAIVVGAADPDPAAREDARNRLGEDVVVAECDEALYSQTDCDAVIIASGDPYHVENALAALDRGKDIFLEKPVAQEMEGLRQIVEAWRRSDCVLMVGLELRQCSVFQKMREWLDANAIGRVLMGMAFDNVSVGGRYFYHNHYRKRAYTRSLILQKGTHTIDLLNWFMDARPVRSFCTGGMNVFGADPAAEGRRCRDCPQAATCPHVIKNQQLFMDYGERKKFDDLCVYAPGADVSDNSMVLVDYANGSRAFYGECHFTPEYTREFTLIGDQGKMTGFFNNECEFKVTVQRVDSPTEMRVSRPRPTMDGGHGGSDTLALIEFARRVRERDRCEGEFWQIVEGAALSIAAADSEESEQPVPVPDFRNVSDSASQR